MGDAKGNGTEAARLAGYKGSNAVLGVQSSVLLKKPRVQAALEARRADLASASIANAKERREILTTIMRSGEAAPVDRTRAIDVANKMDALYVEKHEHAITVPESIAFLITKAPNADCRN